MDNFNTTGCAIMRVIKLNQKASFDLCCGLLFLNPALYTFCTVGGLVLMGFLAHRLRTLDRLLVSPSEWEEMFRCMCLQSHLQTSPRTPKKSYLKFRNPRTTLLAIVDMLYIVLVNYLCNSYMVLKYILSHLSHTKTFTQPV